MDGSVAMKEQLRNAGADDPGDSRTNLQQPQQQKDNKRKTSRMESGENRARGPVYRPTPDGFGFCKRESGRSASISQVYNGISILNWSTSSTCADSR